VRLFLAQMTALFPLPVSSWRGGCRRKFTEYFDRRRCRSCGWCHVDGCRRVCFGEFAADTERADLDRERKELVADPKHEQEELAAIYVGRGLDAGLASKVATQLMAHDALGAHARDELGISEH